MTDRILTFSKTNKAASFSYRNYIAANKVKFFIKIFQSELIISSISTKFYTKFFENFSYIEFLNDETTFISLKAFNLSIVSIAFILFIEFILSIVSNEKHENKLFVIFNSIIKSNILQVKIKLFYEKRNEKKNSKKFVKNIE